MTLQKRVNKPAYPPVAWQALSNQGLNDGVFALAVSGDDLYVGGFFTKTGDLTLNFNGIARYDTKTNTWDTMPNQGLSDGTTVGTVKSLAMSGDDLYVGGEFSQTGDGTWSNLGNIAHYNTTTNTWHPLAHQGLNGQIFALAVSGDDLYVGGGFDATGDGSLTNLGCIVRYNTTTNTWHSLAHQGLNGGVHALVVSGDDLYVGGSFDATGDGSLINLGSIARYNTTTNTWNALPNQGLNGRVHALAVSGDDLYIGGFFTKTNDPLGKLNNLGSIARYDTVAEKWHALPNQGLKFDLFNDPVRALAVSGNDLFVVGYFIQTGDALVNDLYNITRYDTHDGSWYAMPNQGMQQAILALSLHDSDLYVAGWIAYTHDVAITDLGNIARCTLDVPKFSGYLPLVVK